MYASTIKRVITPHGTLTAIMAIFSSIIPENGYAHTYGGRIMGRKVT